MTRRSQAFEENTPEATEVTEVTGNPPEEIVDVSENPEETWIMYRIPKVIDGVQMTEDHRVRTSEAAAFEREHGL
jgi:hypothetical protein